MLNKLDQVLTLQQFKEHKNKYIIKHSQNYGIPQGSAISAILSNIYMLEFDKKNNCYIHSQKGLYMRYSDDFIIVLPKHNEDLFKEQYDYINSTIKLIPKLILQRDKTQIYEFSNKLLVSCNELVLKGVNNGINYLNYLGFTFDGQIVTIRDKTISKYYYRMYRKLKTIIKNNGITKNGNIISCENIYEKYSIKGTKKVESKVKGKGRRKGNFISYVKRAENIFGKGEAISRGTKNHMQKIRNKLKLIKKV